MSTGVNLVDAVSAQLSFWSVYSIETGFDFMYVETSGDGGLSWVKLATFSGTQLNPWSEYTYSLGGFVGKPDVRVRFHLVTDPGLELDGVYIDDVTITSYNVDNAPPLILHTPPEFYKGLLGDFNVNAEIVDISGLSDVTLTYRVDGSNTNTVSGINTYDHNYLFVIPQQDAGAWVSYVIRAMDASPLENAIETDTARYISGNYIAYDNGIVNGVTVVSSDSPSVIHKAADRMTLTGSTTITAALIRNYTDSNSVNNDMEVRLWSASGGSPDTNIIAPITIAPEASLTNPMVMTRVDLRPYSSQLDSMTGDVFLGLTVPSGQVHLTTTTPPLSTRSRVSDSATWTNASRDFHFRLITSALAGAPVAAFSVNAVNEPTLAFSNQSTGSPTSWSWNFGDGTGTSTAQNPSYKYLRNGTFNVCLTATNAVGSNTACQLVTIDAYPNADFTFDATASPTVSFSDASSNNPTTWEWDFDELGAGSILQNPSHIFSGAGVYNVCLVAANTVGAGLPKCRKVTIGAVGVEQSADTDWKVYPNPARDEVMITMPQGLAEDRHEVTVIGVDGRVTLLEAEVVGDQMLVRLNQLTGGVYLLRVAGANIGWGGRVVKF